MKRTEPMLEVSGVADGAEGENAYGFSKDLLRVYLPAIVGFLVINITNATLLGLLEKHGRLYVSGNDHAANELKTIQFFLIPAKAMLFTVCTGLLAWRIWPATKSVFERLRAKDVLQTVVSILIGCVLCWTILPLGFGRQYARISTDPFNQVPDQLYRRLLVPGLAYVMHVNGFLYVVVVWGIVFAAVLATKSYLASRGQRLSLLEEISLLTVGVFITSFQVPGNPEAAVYLLALIALMDFERGGRFSGVQVAALSLALMAHETCAFIVFAPMILFLFPSRSWLPCLGVGTVYCAAVLANFSFHATIPIALQNRISEVPSSVYFMRDGWIDVAAVFFSFKIFWVLIAVGLYYLLKENLRAGLFCLAGLALAIGSMYVAVDYTRLMGFATLALIFCYVESAKHLSKRVWKTVVVLNLLMPSIFVTGPSRLVAFAGLNGFGARWVVKLLDHRI